MTERIFNHKINTLIKIQLKNKLLQKRAILGIVILSVMALISTINIINKTSLSGVNINMWDIMISITNDKFFIFFIYVPIFIVITGIFQKRDSSIMNILIRTNNKKQWVRSNIIATTITCVAINLILYIIFFLISLIFAKNSSVWSEFILNTTDVNAIINGVCERGFVAEYGPIQVIFLSFFLANLGIMSIMFFRDMLVEQATSLKIANLIVIIGIFFNNYIMGELPTVFLDKLKYIGINHMIMFGFHDFGPKNRYFYFTVNQSIITVVTIILIIISLRIKLSKRMVIKNEI